LLVPAIRGLVGPGRDERGRIVRILLFALIALLNAVPLQG